MTPLALKIIIHFHTSNEPFPNSACMAQQKEIKHLVSEGLITPVTEQVTCITPDTLDPGVIYQTTDRGDAFVKMLRETPLPEKRWVDPRGCYDAK